jgi:hypothetical protein
MDDQNQQGINNGNQEPGRVIQPEQQTPQPPANPYSTTPQPAPEPQAAPAPQPEPITTSPDQVFIDNPATQANPNLGQPAPAPISEPKKPKSKKKIFLLVLLALVLLGIGAYFVFANKEEAEEPAPTADTTQAETVDALMYQTSTRFKAYDIKNSSAVDLNEIPDGSTVLSTNEDGTEIYYAAFSNDTPEAEAQLKPTTLKVFKETESSTDLVLETKSFTFPDIAYPVLSSDKSQVTYYAYPDQATADSNSGAKVYTAKLDKTNTETELVDGVTEQHGPLIPVVWSKDDSSIYMSNAGCYQCDAPQTANIWKVDVASKSIENVFEQPDKTAGGGAVVSPDGNKIAVYATGFDLDQTFATISAQPFEAYVIDLGNDSSEKIYTEKTATTTSAESLQAVTGWSQDSSNLLVSVFDVTNTPSGELNFTRVFDRFDAVSATDGKVSPIPVKVDALNNSIGITATTFSEQLFFTAKILAADGSDTSSYSFYGLPLGDGVSEVKTIESALPKLKILGSGKIVSQIQN